MTVIVTDDVMQRHVRVSVEDLHFALSDKLQRRLFDDNQRIVGFRQVWCGWDVDEMCDMVCGMRCVV